MNVEDDHQASSSPQGSGAATSERSLSGRTKVTLEFAGGLVLLIVGPIAGFYAAKHSLGADLAQAKEELRRDVQALSARLVSVEDELRATRGLREHATKGFVFNQRNDLVLLRGEIRALSEFVSTWKAPVFEVEDESVGPGTPDANPPAHEKARAELAGVVGIKGRPGESLPQALDFTRLNYLLSSDAFLSIENPALVEKTDQVARVVGDYNVALVSSQETMYPGLAQSRWAKPRMQKGTSLAQAKAFVTKAERCVSELRGALGGMEGMIEEEIRKLNAVLEDTTRRTTAQGGTP